MENEKVEGSEKEGKLTEFGRKVRRESQSEEEQRRATTEDKEK